MKIFNKIIFSVLMLFFFTLIGGNILSVSANCSLDYKYLEDYYKASSEENFSSYISLMDTNYIYTHLATKENYKNYVESAWKVYDVLGYHLHKFKCVDLPEGTLIFFNLKSKIQMDKKVVDLDRDYVAVFERERLQFVIDLETFSLHQNQAYMLQYYNATKNIVKKELNLAEQMNSYYRKENDNDINKLLKNSGNSNLNSETSKTTFYLLFIFFILVIGSFSYLKYIRSDLVKERSLSDDKKANVKRKVLRLDRIKEILLNYNLQMQKFLTKSFQKIKIKIKHLKIRSKIMTLVKLSEKNGSKFFKYLKPKLRRFQIFVVKKSFILKDLIIKKSVYIKSRLIKRKNEKDKRR